LRIPGLTLAVTTLGFAVIAPDWLYLQHRIGGDTPFTTFVEFPSVARGLGDASSKQYLYYVALVVLALAVAAAAALRRSAIGRTIIAVRDNERACAALGIQPAIVKLRILGVSGFIAAAAGVLYATAWQRVTPLQFGADISIAILAIPVIGGLGSIGGAVAAAVLLYASTFFIGPHVSGLFGDLGQNVGFLLFIGGIGVVGGMLNFPNGIAGKVQESWQARLDRKAKALEGETPPSVDASDEPDIVDAVVPAFAFRADRVAADDPGIPPLAVSGVAIRFGGVAALDGVDINVGPGEIVGLIGPNGAGKTTLMNIVSGALRPNRGSVRVFGHEVSGRSAQVRARLGVARSFQDASSFAGLTVTEAVQLALARQGKTGLLPALIGAPWVRAAERDSRQRAAEIVEAFGLQPWADALTAELSTGTRRVCELAVQVATEPRLLLLDEPTAGVAQRDAEAFGPLMRRIRDELDCSILVIEHDMPLLMGLCDRAYAMEAGRVIAEGTPTELRNNPIVIASYLGTDTVALNRSDRRVGAPSRVAPSQA
jgi:ABC-type branched-subunit amino acid transport system ATPase component